MEIKNIKDYLHLYLGQLATLSNLSQRMIVYGWEDGQAKINGYLIDCLEKENSFTIKPILRQLSDMTEEDRKELNIIQQNDSSYPTMAYALAPHFKYLLSKGFDLFGLIEAGLAIKKSQ